MQFEPLIRKLEAVEVLTDLEKHEAVSLCGDVHTVARRHDIISEGDVPETVHIILNGWAARYNILRDGTRRITAFLIPGDFCDIHTTALAAMDHSIMAITDCEVAHVASEKIDEITRSFPGLTRALWRSTLIDEAILRQWLVHAGRRDAAQTIAHLLSELHARMQLVGQVQDGRLSLPLTQDEIGDATGISAVHVNRTVRSLREQGLLTVSKSELHVPDVAALRQMCGFNANYLHLRRLEPAG